MKKEEVRARIEHVGLVPVIRAVSAKEARFAAEAVCEGGIPILEITMTVPGALEVISHGGDSGKDCRHCNAADHGTVGVM